MIFQWNALPWLCIVLVLFFATGGDVIRSFPVWVSFFDDVVSVRLKRKTYNGGLCLRLGAVIFLNPGEGFIPSLRHHHETSPVSPLENLPSIESCGLRL